MNSDAYTLCTGSVTIPAWSGELESVYFCPQTKASTAPLYFDDCSMIYLNDPSSLKALVESLQNTDLSGYTKESGDAFKAALETAKLLVDHPAALKAQLEQAAASLEQTAASLEQMPEEPVEGTDRVPRPRGWIHYHQNSEMAAQLAREVRELGSDAFCVQADVTSLAEVQQMAQEIERCFTPVDLLVANAYIHLKQEPPFLQTPIEDYIEQYNGTVLQNLHLIHTFIPKMQQQGGDRYIGINTVASVNCLTMQAAYSTSKRALDGLLRTLAKEVAKDHILVN